MAVMNGGAEKPHDVILSSDENPNPIPSPRPNVKRSDELGDDVNLYGLSVHLIESILDQNSCPQIATRIKQSFADAAPLFRKACLNTRRDVLLWTRGSHLRALFVVFVSFRLLLF